MSTLTIEVPVTTDTTTVELKLPAFRKWKDDSYYQIVRSDLVIHVQTYDSDKTVEVIKRVPNHAVCTESVEITEEEFIVAYYAAKDAIDAATRTRS